MDVAWFTVAELASLELPGLPGNPLELEDRATSEGWREWQGLGGQPLARRRKDTAEWEYNVVGLPQEAFCKVMGMDLHPGPLGLDKGALHAVSIGWTRHDLLCEWPDSHRGAPVSVAVQDAHSRKLLTIRHDRAESVELMLAALIDVIEDFGVPRYVLASDRWCKLMPAAFTDLMLFESSIRPLPINRAWRSFREGLDRSAEMDGAFTGFELKPRRAVPFERFQRAAQRQLQAHNARDRRPSPSQRTASSFNDAFNASYRHSIIGKMTARDLSRLREIWGRPRVALDS